MLLPIYEGPKERVQAKIETLSRPALVCLCLSWWQLMKGLGWLMPIEVVEADIEGAKRIGKSVASISKHNRYLANPDAYINQMISRSRAAKKAARRRKRGR